MRKKLDKIKRLIEGNQELKLISSNISWLLLEKASRYLLGFLVSIWVVRYLGPAQYGLLNYAIAFTAIIGTFIGFGLENMVVRDLIKYPERRDALLSNAFVLFFISSLIALFICLLSIFLLRNNDTQTILLVCILSLGYLLKPFNVIALYFESKVLGKLLVPYTIAGLIIINLLKIYLVYFGYNLYAFAGVFVLENVLTTLSMLYVFKASKLKLKIKWGLDISLVKPLLKGGLPLMLSAFMITIYMKIDQVMLREMVSAKEVGLYSVAVVLTSVWFVLPMVITRSFFPKNISTLTNSKALFESQLQRLYNLIAFIGYGFCIPLTFLSEYLVVFLYGETFSAAGSMLSVLIWTAFVTGFGVVRMTYVYAMDLTKQHLIITILGAILNIILNLFLIPIYQGFGAVLATLISQIFASYVSSFIFRSLRQNGIMMVKATLFPKIF